DRRGPRRRGGAQGQSPGTHPNQQGGPLRRERPIWRLRPRADRRGASPSPLRLAACPGRRRRRAAVNDRSTAPLLALVGPTASGKTEASIAIAQALSAEIVCVDSMLVYRGMDVGTAKPSRDLRDRVPHHLLDVADPAEPFSVARFQALARDAIDDITSRNRNAFL